MGGRGVERGRGIVEKREKGAGGLEEVPNKRLHFYL